MTDWAECLKYYAKHIKWHITIFDKQWCEYYQNRCCYHKD